MIRGAHKLSPGSSHSLLYQTIKTCERSDFGHMKSFSLFVNSLAVTGLLFSFAFIYRTIQILHRPQQWIKKGARKCEQESCKEIPAQACQGGVSKENIASIAKSCPEHISRLSMCLFVFTKKCHKIFVRKRKCHKKNCDKKNLN